MNCNLCGTPVKVVGRTTQHYEPITPMFTEEQAFGFALKAAQHTYLHGCANLPAIIKDIIGGNYAEVSRDRPRKERKHSRSK